MKKRPLYLIPTGFIFLIGPLIPSPAEDMVYVFLLGAVSCVLPIVFSSGWPKYTGIFFCVLFLFTAGFASQKAKERARITTTRSLESKTTRAERQRPPTTGAGGERWLGVSLGSASKRHLNMKTDSTIALVYKGKRTVWEMGNSVIWKRKSAKVSLFRKVFYKPDDVVLNLEGTGRPIEGGLEHDCIPSVTLSWLMYPFSMDALDKHVIKIPKAYDSMVSDHVATLYYFEHNELNNVEITFVRRIDDGFQIHVTGKADSPWRAKEDINELIDVSVDCIVKRVER